MLPHSCKFVFLCFLFILTENSTAFAQGHNNTQDILMLTLSSQEHSDQTALRFSAEATEDFDPSLDAEKLMNGASTPSVFTILDEIDYAVNSLPITIPEQHIPLAMLIQFDGTYTIDINLSGFEDQEEVLLKDLLTDSTINLREKLSYTFDITSGRIEDRFTISYTNPIITANQQQQAPQGISVYSTGHLLNIHWQPLQSGAAELLVADAQGKTVYQTQVILSNSDHLISPLPFMPSGIYTVRLQSPAAVFSRQVFISTP